MDQDIYSDWLWVGRSGRSNSRKAEIFLIHSDQTWGHLATYKMGTGSLFRG